MKHIIPILFLLFSHNSISSDIYDIEMVRSDRHGNWGAIRFQPTSGKSWLIKGGIFVQIEEKNTPSKGNYKIKMVQTKSGWSATRIETGTGRGWYLKDQVWKPVLESSE